MACATTPERAEPNLDPAVFRRVIGNFMSGVVVITTDDQGYLYGMTVSAVSSLCLEPPMLLVCLNANSATQDAVNRSGRFAVNILAEDQGELAERFAQPGSANKFDGITTRSGRTGAPLLPGILAALECQVAEVVSGGTHRVFVANVVHAETSEGSPLGYFRGKFGKFELGEDIQVYHRVRQLILTRQLGPGEKIDIPSVAVQVTGSQPSVYYALSRLVGEKLVTRDADRRHVVTPLDATTSDDIHDAKLAIELGAAELITARLTHQQLVRFRELADAAAALIHDGRFLNLEAYLDANHAFHRFFIEATGIRALVEAYEQLSLRELTARALADEPVAAPHLVDDHFALIDSLEKTDLAAVRHVINSHNEKAKAAQRAGILRSGGSL